MSLQPARHGLADFESLFGFLSRAVQAENLDCVCGREKYQVVNVEAYLVIARLLGSRLSLAYDLGICIECFDREVEFS